MLKRKFLNPKRNNFRRDEDMVSDEENLDRQFLSRLVPEGSKGPSSERPRQSNRGPPLCCMHPSLSWYSSISSIIVCTVCTVCIPVYPDPDSSISPIILPPRAFLLFALTLLLHTEYPWRSCLGVIEDHEIKSFLVCFLVSGFRVAWRRNCNSNF